MSGWLQKVVGESFNNRQSIIDQLNEGEEVKFIREPDNPYDEFAILVMTEKGDIGYIPKEHAPRMADHMDDGFEYQAQIYSVHGGGELSLGVVLLVSTDEENNIPPTIEQLKKSKGKKGIIENIKNLFGIY